MISPRSSLIVKCASSVLVVALLFTLYPIQPARADILDYFSDAVCAVYENSIGYVLQELESFVEGLFKQKVDDAINSTINVAIPSLSDIIGGSVPVYDENVQKEIIKEGIKNAKRQEEIVKANTNKINCQETVRRATISIVKRRILDVIVDDIINWINTDDFPEGSPRFVSNFQDFLDTAKRPRTVVEY